jgi:acyl-CoA synthetase (AMP-forming)/AMP-acid ligase II
MLNRVRNRLEVVDTLRRAGLVKPSRPDRLARAGMAYLRWKPTPAGGFSVADARYPDQLAIADELGTLTFHEVHTRTNALANALSDMGVNEGDGVAVMCRNHRGFIEATVACSKLGANVLYLNTSFAGPQLADVVARENPTTIIYDEEFHGLVKQGAEGRRQILAWVDDQASAPLPTLEQLISSGDPSDPVPPEKPARVIILTSGTTGTPKGANRSAPKSLDPVAAFLSRIPLKAGETTMIAAPMFHAWGYANFQLAMVLTSTIVLRRKFDPEATLAATAQSRATTLVVVPVMLQRILELPDEVIDRYDLSELTAIVASGSALPGELAIRTMDRFGDILYNLYGSTEVAFGTIATPEDLRAAPGTAGKPPLGTVLKIFDEDGNEVPQGETGRIFIANEVLFEGYTGGTESKAVIQGLMSTGDVGHIDEGGRLHIDGRDDDMIVSGGENVFPREVEDLLAEHEKVGDVTVIGVDDEQFGQRLKAYVVPRKGTEPTEDELKKYVKSNLANYKVPREVVFLDELPRNPAGKVVKRELP